MSHDPSKPAWPGQQPTSFDPFTGKPVYAAPESAQPQYGQPPQQPQYGQPQAPQYGQPPAPQYGAPQQPNYGQPPGPHHGASPQQPYGAPPQQPYGAPPQQPYGAQQPDYGQPHYPPQQHQPYGGAADGYQQQGHQQQGHQQQGHQQQGHQQQQGAYPQAPQGAYGHRPGADEEPSGGLRGTANATVAVSDRVRFIRMTYIHLLAAIVLFAAVEWAFFNVRALDAISMPWLKFALGGRWNWAAVLGLFMVTSWVADHWASSSTSRGVQYAGLTIYVIAEAFIFLPLLAIVEWKTAEILAKGGHEPHIIRDAGVSTVVIFGVLTAFVVFSKKDFSFIRGALGVASGAAMVLVILSLIGGFNLGIIFSIAMVVLASGYVLYQTSQVLAHYNTENYVAAALALFSSIALMFWYLIRIFMRMRE